MRAAAAAFGVSPATAHRWSHRWLDGGRQRAVALLLDRSSRPRRSPRLLAPSWRSGSAPAAARPAGARGWSQAPPASRTRPSGRCSGAPGSRAAAASIREPANRYEWPCPGDLLHMDVCALCALRAARPRGHRRPLAALTRLDAPETASATTTLTRSSTTTRGWPTSSSTTTRRQPPSPPSWSARWPSSRATGSSRKRLMTDNAFTYVKNRSLRELLADRDIRHLTTAALPAPHQRQGRTLPPNDGPRMGLRPHLPLTSTPQPSAATLARALQPARPHSSLGDRPPDQPRSQRPWAGQFVVPRGGCDEVSGPSESLWVALGLRALGGPDCDTLTLLRRVVGASWYGWSSMVRRCARRPLRGARWPAIALRSRWPPPPHFGQRSAGTGGGVEAGRGSVSSDVTPSGGAGVQASDPERALSRVGGRAVPRARAWGGSARGSRQRRSAGRRGAVRGDRRRIRIGQVDAAPPARRPRPPVAGSVVVAGTSLAGLSQSRLARFRRDTIGFVFQAFQLVPELSAWENVLLPVRLAHDLGEGRKRAACSSTSWASPSSLADCRSISRAASSNASRLHARSPCSRASSWRTSPPATSTPLRVRTSSNCCGRRSRRPVRC